MRLVGQRLLQLVAVLLVVSFLTFLLTNLLPGGPEVAILGVGATDEAVAELREDLRLDDPIPTRYARWLGDAVTGDLGQSYVNRTPVMDRIQERLPVTLQLMVYAQILALALAIPLGILTAYKADTLVDRATNTFAFGLLSIPNFILGVLLVFLLALKLGWFPATGTVPFADDPGEHFRSFFLPALTLAAGQMAVYLRLLRTDMIATLQEDYIGTAKAKGMPTRRILLRHAFRPSSFSLLTVAGINIGQLVGGTFIIEQIFAIQGIGDMVVRAIFTSDYLVIQGAVVVIAAGFVIVNFFVDMLYAVLDPRIRHARAVA